MDKIDNSNLKLELFNYKKGLTLEQEDIERQISFHLNLFNCDDTGKNVSQKNILRNLNERLKPFTYDNSVKTILESLNTMVKEDEIFYDLEDLFRTLENANQGMVYRHVMKVVLDIINEGNTRNQQILILNELALHDWIPAVKNFLFKYTTNPKDRQNISSKGGKATSVISLVEKVNTDEVNGFLTYIGDKWFILTENSITPCTPSDYFKDRERLHSLNLLQKALQIGEIKEDKIYFKIDEDLNLAISFNNGEIFINNEKAEKSASLESIFDSALIPFMRKDMYPIVSETVKNLDKFVDLDVVQKVTNFTQPTLEIFAFNYKDKMYVYSVDTRYGNHFYEYDSATMLCNEMNREVGYDLSTFFKNKFSEEKNLKTDLEDKEKFVANKLADVNENMDKLKTCGLFEISEEIKTAYDVLITEKVELETELHAIKSSLSNKKWSV